MEADVVLTRRTLTPCQYPQLVNFGDETFIYDENDVDFDPLEDWMGGLLFQLSE